MLWIAEVRSRFDGSAGHASVESFLAVCAQLGFKLKVRVHSCVCVCVHSCVCVYSCGVA